MSPTRARKSTTCDGRHAQALGGVGLVHPDLVHRRGPAAAGIEQGDARADQLVEVLVARDDDRLEPALRRRPGQGADHVVGLVAGDGHERNPEGLEQLADPLDRAVEVGLQLLVQLFAGGLVVGVALPRGRRCRRR